jgi:hypothetical protein
VVDLPFEDRADFEDADRGLIGALDPGVVKNATGGWFGATTRSLSCWIPRTPGSRSSLRNGPCTGHKRAPRRALTVARGDGGQRVRSGLAQVGQGNPGQQRVDPLLNPAGLESLVLHHWL